MYSRFGKFVQIKFLIDAIKKPYQRWTGWRKVYPGKEPGVRGPLAKATFSVCREPRRFAFAIHLPCYLSRKESTSGGRSSSACWMNRSAIGCRLPPDWKLLPDRKQSPHWFAAVRVRVHPTIAPWPAARNAVSENSRRQSPWPWYRPLPCHSLVLSVWQAGSFHWPDAQSVPRPSAVGPQA